jgi:hypothetical protein
VGKKALQIKVVWGPFHGIVWTIVDDVCSIIFFIFLGGNLGQWVGAVPIVHVLRVSFLIANAHNV